jgi:hypothetical protein
MAQHYSGLWGENGELWEPGKALQDFSRVAGYHQGMDPFPRWPVKVNVKDFGARGDGNADDTKAITDAIKACPANGAVFLPAGKYKITDWIRIPDLRNIIIRGEDMYETQLIIPIGLEAIHPNPGRTTSGINTTNWSWGGGFFWFDNARELGIENLSFIFPDKQYKGHFMEEGYNMIRLSGTDIWVCNVRGYNADSGIYLHGTYTTLRNILLDAFPGRPQEDSRFQFNGRSGHHAIDIQGGKHNLVENYTETVKYIHSLGSEGNAQWNVWCRCKGPDIEIDHHTHSASMDYNLYTDIDMGIGRGAEGQRDIHSFRYQTYWNLRSSQELFFDPASGGIKQGIPIIPEEMKNIVVGWWLEWPEEEKNKRYPDLPWYEYIGNYNDIYPPNIYIAQVKKRLGVDNLPPEVRITRPLPGAAFPEGTDVTITAMADDRDGELADVDLLLYGRSIGRLDEPPYEWKLEDLEGTYRIAALARDDKGAISMDTLSFSIGDPTGVRNSGTLMRQPVVIPGKQSVQVTFYHGDAVEVTLALYASSGARIAVCDMAVSKGMNRFTWKEGLPKLAPGGYVLVINTPESRLVAPFVY